MKINRRNFILAAHVLGVSSALPVWSRALALTAELPRLPVPPIMSADSRGEIALNIQSGISILRPGVSTPTWGINGSLLGPVLRLERGKSVTMVVSNGLPEPTTIHWHGLEVPGAADGGPQAVINPKGQWRPQFLVDQPAATCWFHPHIHQKTGYHVAMGLAGMILIEDQESSKLPLPKSWGIDDIPVILQDKKLTSDGKIDYQLDIVAAAVGWFGDLMLTNGVAYPQHVAPRGWLRLRFLNGCNARALNLSVSDNRPLYVIASDGGFLSEPVKIMELAILPGERFEVLVDASDGKAFDILSLPVRQVGMTLTPFDQPLPVLRIQPTATEGEKRLPDQLVKVPALPTMNGIPDRLLSLSMDPRLDMGGMQELLRRYGEKAIAGVSMADHGGMGTGTMDMKGMDKGSTSMPGMDHGAIGNRPAEEQFDIRHANGINNQAFTMSKPSFDVRQGQYEKWAISGEGDIMLHPFHIHGTQFRILSENGKPPAAHRSGWKDIVHVENGKSEVLVSFSHLAPADRMYMAHCHLLEHEDTGMMLPFTVSR